MRKSTFVVAIAASAALVAASAGATFAGGASHNSNRGGAALHQGTKIAPAKIGKMQPDVRFKAFGKPVATYTNRSCDIGLSSIADGTTLSSVTGCSTTVTLSQSWIKVSVPNFWQTWGSPPKTESATPNGLWSNGQFTATVDFGKKVHIGGFEVEPDNFAVETIQVDFYRGPDGTGKLVGSISRRPDGQAGALLYGAKARHGFSSAVISDASGDFAIAQVRV
jgi:hypothetical protein